MDRGGGGGSSDPYYYYFDGSPPASSTDHHQYYGQQEQPSPLGVTTTSSSTTTPAVPSRYESQKRRDWNTFGQYLRNQRPAVPLSQCTCNHVLDFMRYLDQFGKTKVHLQGCVFYGQPDPPAPCTCPLRQAWGSLDALIGRLRAAYEENGGAPENNPFASSAIRVYLREVRDCQAKARGIPYKKKKKPSTSCSSSSSSSSKGGDHHHGGGGGGGDHHSHHLGQISSSSTMMHFS